MRLLIITAIYKRHDLSRIVLSYYKSLQAKYDLQLLAVGSEGHSSLNLCLSCGWDYIEFENKPISQKFNALSDHCKAYDYDAVVLIGSDDLISEEIIKYYIENYHANTPYMVGLKGCYMYEVNKDSLIHFKGYTCKTKRTIGAGRLFSRYVMEKMKYKLWGRSNIDRGLDYRSSLMLEINGIKEHKIDFNDTGGLLVDIKHEVNITPFKNIISNFDEVDPIILEQYFPDQIKEIKKLKNQP